MSDSDSNSGAPARVARVDLKRLTPDHLVLSDEHLRGCPVVKALGTEAAAELFRSGTMRRFADKAKICEQQDAPISVFLVLRGEARLYTDKGFELCASRRGEFFGELAADAMTRSATAIADGETDVLEIPAAAISDALLSSAPFAALLEAVKRGRNKAASESDDFLNRW